MPGSPLVFSPGTLAHVAYIAAFGAAALACFGSLLRAREIAHRPTRRGLQWLLVTSGCWSLTHVIFFVVPTPALKYAVYVAGLVVGLSTVGPWLYFCSAYTGRSLHRSPALRRVAVGVFLAIVAVKLTNPLHQLYFTAELVATPFPHLAIQHGVSHWLAMGLSYALATVGYFMLFELFWQVGHDTRPFVVLVGLTGLPIVADILGELSPRLLAITYEPLGVAAFAVGVVFIFHADFETIRLAGDSDDPIIVLDDENHIRDYNSAAQSLFGTLETGVAADSVVPELLDHLDTDAAILELERAGGLRYYQLSANPYTTDRTRLGQAIVFTDVTDREAYRTELERQNERLERFASMVSHDLRNPLNVARGQLDFLRRETDSERLDAATDALDRMETLIENVLSLARQGQPIDEQEPVDLGVLADECWAMVETNEATLTIEQDGTILADSDRLKQLFENLFRNAVEHGGESVSVRVGLLPDSTGFYVADDGPGIPPDVRDRVLESGYSSADGTGFGLAIVDEIATAHGWTLILTDSADGGARFEITGVTPAD
jgi:signal transduction histidine kinase